MDADEDATEGMAFLGKLHCSDFTTGGVPIGNGEAVVEIIDDRGSGGKVIHIVLISGTTAPYRWEYTYWNKGTNVSGWIGFKPTPKTTTISDNTTVTLADNTEYTGTNINTITFTYPQDDFECYIKLNFADSGTITVTFPNSYYIGNTPEFDNGETWEISIKNGIIVAGKIVGGA